MAKSKTNWYARLNRIFRSGPAIKRRVRDYRSPPTSTALELFSKTQSFVYSNAINAYGQYDRLSRYADFCFAADTLVYTTKGVHTIEELAAGKLGQRFHVYSYDHASNMVVIGDAHSARVARSGDVVERVRVTFDDGGHIDVTPDHKMMLRDGSYVEAGKLDVGTALMPFYVRTMSEDGYRMVYTMDKTRWKGGWLAEHIMVAERFIRPLKEGEVVHHRDFKPSNNLVENLQVLSEVEHKRYHTQLNNRTKYGVPNDSHSSWMFENNPVKRDDVTYERILELAQELDFSMRAVKEKLGADANVIKRHLRRYGFRNWIDFTKRRDEALARRTHEVIVEETRSPGIGEIVAMAGECADIYQLCSRLKCTENAVRRRLKAHGYGTWSEFRFGERFDNAKKVDPAFDDTLTYQMVCDAYVSGDTYNELAQKLATTANKVLTRIEREGFKSYSAWVEAYGNHKVASVERIEPAVVYNLTVEGHHNLAVGSINPSCRVAEKTIREYSMVFARQSEMEYSPEIAAAMDIYCLAGDNVIPLLRGEKKTIRELYDSQEQDFWVYSYDPKNGKHVPGLCRRVVMTGKDQDIKRIKFDDGTSIRVTEKHLVLLSSGEYRRAADLRRGDSVASLYTRTSSKSNGDHLDGYEMMRVGDEWMCTHRVVAEHSQPNGKGVVHHIDFRKWNNDPENLTFMTWDAHKRLHRHSNAERWKNDERYVERMSAAFSAHAKELHAQPGWTRDVFLRRRDDTFATYDSDTRREKFGRPGSQNGMHGMGHMLAGDKNGRWRDDLVRNVDFETLANLMLDGYRAADVYTKLPIRDVDFVAAYRRHGFCSWSFASNKHLLCDVASRDVAALKAALSMFRGNPLRGMKKLCDEVDMTTSRAFRSLNACGYDSWKAFVTAGNHIVVEVVDDGTDDVFDLQVDEWHNFAVADAGGSERGSYVFVHNSDETVSQDEHGKVLHVFSENRKLRNLLEELFYDTLNVDFNLRMWTRNIVKYGDFFLFNDIAPEYGVMQVFPVPVNEVEREEGFDPEDPLAVRFRWVTQGNVALENWQMTHFRMLGNDAFLPYGSSIIEPARRIWRQLVLIEDAMLVYRVVRSPERRIFYIDVGGIPPEEVPNYMEAQEAKLRSSTIIDRDTGRIDYRHNPLETLEDYFIPVRGTESGTKIDTIAGGQHVSATEDVEYIQKKLFAALKVPRAYLGYDEMLSSKATLAQEDIRFSRTIQQIQKVLIAELQKLAYIHLFMNGYEGDDMFDFELRLNNPSSIAQQQKLELFARKFEIIGAAMGVAEGQVFSVPYLLGTIMDMSESKQKQLSDQVVQDVQRRAALAKISEGATPESVGFDGGGGGGFSTAGGPDGPDLDSDLEGGDDLDADAGDDLDAGDDAEPADEPADEGGLDDLFAGHVPEGEVLGEDDPASKQRSKPPLVGMPEDEDAPPVRVSDRLKTKQANRRRSQRRHGPASTHMPDFARMTSMDDPQDSAVDMSVVRNPLKDALKVRLEHLMASDSRDPRILRERVDVMERIEAATFLEGYLADAEPDPEPVKPRLTAELQSILDGIERTFGEQLDAVRLRFDAAGELLSEGVDPVDQLLDELGVGGDLEADCDP